MAVGLAGMIMLPTQAWASEPETAPEQPAEPEPEAEPTEPQAEPVQAEPAKPAAATMIRPPPPAPIEPDPRNYRLVLIGDIVIGLGGAALITMVVGLGIRAEAIDRRDALLVGEADLDAIARQDQRISTGTTLAIAGGAATGALFAAGITMVALGYKRERERRQQLPALYLGPRGAGLSWSLRF